MAGSEIGRNAAWEIPPLTSLADAPARSVRDDARSEDVI